MKTREEVVRFISRQFDRAKSNRPEKGAFEYKGRLVGGAWHYGVLELRELMDFIYEGEPKSESEWVNK